MGDSNGEKSAPEQILDVFRDEFRVTPLLLREHTGLRKQRVNRILNRLRAEGEITKVTTGLYEIDEDSIEVEKRTGRDEQEVDRQQPERDDRIAGDIDADNLEFDGFHGL